jgi:hypothetical protein
MAKDEDSAVTRAEAQLKALKKYPRLEQWSISLSEREIYFADDEPVTMKLEGRIYDHPHPRFTDGEMVTTLELVALDVEAGRAATKQNVFSLGEPDPTFLEYVEGLGKKLEDYNLNEKNIRSRPKPGL